MADGLWTGAGFTEVLRQKQLTRNRLLAVNTSVAGARAVDGSDASSCASVPPYAISAPGYAAPEGGPHFVMSPETPSGNPTLGFQWGICNAVQMQQNVAVAAQFAAGGVDVTVWVLIESTFFPNGGIAPGCWASFDTLTGVQPGEIYRSFDIDASALRFQIGQDGIRNPDGGRGGITVDGVVIMFFAEI